MKPRYLLVCGAAVVAAFVLVFALEVPAETVLVTGGGAVCLLWLVLLLTVPWNLYFRARAVVHEAGVSREKGLAVPADRDAEAARIATVMLRLALGAHLVTGAVTVLAAWATGRKAGYWLAGFYLLSTVFRPAGGYFGALRRRLVTLHSEVRFPRDDVGELKTAVTALRKGLTVTEEKSEETYRALAELRRSVDAVGLSTHQRADHVEQRFEALTREFDSTLNRLTDNQEIITGLKAFLRMLRAEGGGERLA
ncbi:MULTISPECIES: hypothetical protein [unclassified Streptomyces]|uniref:hypothetical protein n=1 Tax=unclassified Streptomyces TaxID=2593676 RepID=UPI00278C0150|nr:MULTISPECIES: hypothetical protein [unclassified Streptomyces]